MKKNKKNYLTGNTVSKSNIKTKRKFYKNNKNNKVKLKKKTYNKI